MHQFLILWGPQTGTAYSAPPSHSWLFVTSHSGYATWLEAVHVGLWPKKILCGL